MLINCYKYWLSMRFLSLFNNKLKYKNCLLEISRNVFTKPLMQSKHQNCLNVSLFKFKQKSSLNYNLFKLIQKQFFSFDSKVNQNCWKCKQRLNDSKVMSKLFCHNCQSIQALDWDLNYFELFDQNISFDINLFDLHNTFKALQMVAHPDRSATASQREKKYCLDNSSLINSAYRTLADPYERGLYLLQLFGSSVSESDTGIDSQFLTFIMELNEEIEENENSKQKLSNILKDNEKNTKEVINEISVAFSSGDITKAKELLSKFKFYITLDSNLKQKLQNLV